MPAPVRRAAGIPHPASPAPGLISGRVVPADWIGARVGAAAAVAERDALGTSVRVAAWPPDGLAAALAAVDAELDRLDRQASRFRASSELSRIHRARPRSSAERRSGRGDPRRAHRRAMDSWRDRSDGGRRAHRAGYDRDFAAIGAGTPPPPAGPGPVPGWRSVTLDGTALRLPAGIVLDLGATAKGLGSDRAAAAAGRACGQGGVLVSLGGDIAVAGLPPRGGWPVAVADSCDPGGGPLADTAAGRRATQAAAQRARLSGWRRAAWPPRR